MLIHKLGKKPKVTDRFDRTLQLGKYLLKGALPAPPKQEDWLSKIPEIPMYCNDKLGCCVISAMAHMLDQWSFLTTGKIFNFSDQQIIGVYSAITGYNPNAPLNPDGSNPTDQGTDWLTALNYWRQTGFCGLKIEGFAEFSPQSPTEFEQSISLFGNTAIGVELPIAVQGADSWKAPPNQDGDWASGSWGGHGIPSGAYKPGIEEVETWGGKLWMSDAFAHAYISEQYVVFFPGWVGAKGESPSGIDLAQLKADLAQITA